MRNYWTKGNCSFIIYPGRPDSVSGTKLIQTEGMAGEQLTRKHPEPALWAAACLNSQRVHPVIIIVAIGVVAIIGGAGM